LSNAGLTGVFDLFFKNQQLTPVYPLKNMACCGNIVIIQMLIGTGFAGYQSSDETCTKL
jgi:hypothetical protein